ncbi:hypothetical protein BDF19DRAFT_468945 [Syncephalis fuscata]|nr:hypothetical protein BDF19DRAFT_468945 [Syncephalis fuscata]
MSIDSLPDNVIWHPAPFLSLYALVKLAGTSHRFHYLLDSDNSHLWQTIYKNEFSIWGQESNLIIYLNEKFNGNLGAYWARRRLKNCWKNGFENWPRISWKCPITSRFSIGACSVSMAAVRMGGGAIGLFEYSNPTYNYASINNRFEQFVPTKILTVPELVQELIELDATKNIKITVEEKTKESGPWTYQRIVLFNNYIVEFATRGADPPLLLLNIQVNNHILMGLRGRDTLAAYNLLAPPDQCQKIWDLSQELALAADADPDFVVATTSSCICEGQLISDTVAIFWGSSNDQQHRRAEWIVRCEALTNQPKWIYECPSNIYKVTPMPEYNLIVISMDIKCFILNLFTGGPSGTIRLQNNGPLVHLLGPLFIQNHETDEAITLIDVAKQAVLWHNISYKSLLQRNVTGNINSNNLSATVSNRKGLLDLYRKPPIRMAFSLTRLLLQNHQMILMVYSLCMPQFNKED